MRYILVMLLVGFCIVCFSSMKDAGYSVYTEHTLQQFRISAKDFALSTTRLKQAVNGIEERDKESISNARAALRDCRLKYKHIEYFMEYFFQYPVNIYNRAPVYEVEEPYMEYQSPIGLQVVEGLLLDADVFTHKKELVDQCEVIDATASDIPSLLYDFSITDNQILESIRLEFIRIIALGITGYDAPLLKSGMEESAAALQAVRQNIVLILNTKGGEGADSTLYYLEKAITLLRDGENKFDNFDRLTFLTHAALPLQKHFSLFVHTAGLDINTHNAVNHKAEYLFSKDAINMGSGAVNEQNIISLGKKLFNEKMLSGNGSRNCATCHQPGKYFTDGQVKSKTIDGKGVVTRNAPTLLYAAMQRTQFHDGRAGSLEEQIKIVLQSPLEMNADLGKITAFLNADPQYVAMFQKAFPASNANITIEQVAIALSSYEQTLTPFNAPFDKYIAGDSMAMTPKQKQGFNLFMGKAQCGTCHFAPVFNGLLPPYYEVSELEVLGVPANKSKRHAVADADSGRYHFFPISFNNGAFKTTTVRNTAKTSPYMHNGVYGNLNQVINFYNKGGGNGIGLKIEGQTLSDKPLKLNKTEVAQLVSFLEALTDDIDGL